MVDVSSLINKADVLNEALPFIQKFKDSIAVVKFGGSAMENPELTRKTMRDIVLLEAIGMKMVVVHGGGKAISARLKELGVETRFVNGLRVTDDATISVVDDVLHNNTNKSLVDGITAVGGRGVSISGKKIMRAEKLWSKDAATGEKLDIGYVGKVIAVDVNPVLDALKYKFIPVITPLAMDFHGQTYNINADTAACEIAKALQARKLVFLSDVPGILRDPKEESTLISVIRTSEVDGLIAEGVLSGGMLPKIQSSVSAIKAGTKEVHMIDGRNPHSLLLEIFTNSGIGTEIIEG
ncbi:MAG: acetylglutamate kinase [Lentisphaeria bacterium]|nr:acetylglutamate kinase [Lentisphaeria bacterium]